jgi:hypothetical protein
MRVTQWFFGSVNLSSAGQSRDRPPACVCVVYFDYSL